MNNYFEQWYKEHKGYTIRNYADRILNKEIPEAFVKNNIVVLAAAPNSGKTLMTIAWMEKYLIENSTHRILVLTHGRSILRNQFYEDIKQAKVNFTHEIITNGKKLLFSNKQVVVSLPQTIISNIDLDVKSFDVLIVDEAHHYYCVDDGMISTIIEKYKFKKQLLLTGTPAPFVAKNMDIIAVALEELIEGGFASDPIIVVTKSNYRIRDCLNL